jgi:2-dehydro-3-deoxyphosphooctonate aldolase (KDO 8-P synthase)
MQARVVRVGAIEIANDRPFVLIAGPCQIESRAHALETADGLRPIATAGGVPVIY